MKRIISLLSAALLVAGSKAADIRGYVVDAETGEALAAANVFIKGSSAGTTADVRGILRLTLLMGQSLPQHTLATRLRRSKQKVGKKR